MVRTGISKCLMFIYYVLGALVLEAFSFHVLNLGFMPQYFFYDFSIILFLGMLVYAIPNYIAQYVFATIVLLVQSILIYTNYTLYIVYGDMFSFDMLSLLIEAAEASTSGFVFWSVIIKLVVIFMLITGTGIAMLIFAKKDKINVKQHFSKVFVLMVIAIQCVSLTSYAVNRSHILATSNYSTSYVNSDAFLMNTSFMKRSSYSKFGSYGYFVNMMLNEFNNNGKSGLNNQKKQVILDYFNDGSIYNGSSLNEEGKTTFGVDNGNNVIVFMMESTEWYGFGDGNYDPTLSNLSNELTPNVYSLIFGDLADINDNSIVASKFFGKAKTNISEGIGVMGNYPNGLNFLDYAGKKFDKSKNSLGFSLPNVLKSQGYTTTYLHSNRSTFYDRNITHVNIGFDQVIGKELLTDDNGNLLYTGDDLKWDNWAPEGEIVRNAMDYIIPETYKENPFFTFYLNVSSHGSFQPEYNLKDGDVLKYTNYVKYGPDDCVLQDGKYVLNKAENQATYTNWYQNILNNYSVSDAKLITELTNYQCGICGLDEAIGEIINELKSKTYDDGTTLYDKTTMLLYSDHYSYYDNMSYRVKNIDAGDIGRTEVHQIPMILSSPGIKELNKTLTNKLVWNDRFCSAYDIIPTILDLLGIPFNENLYVGNSLFRPADIVYEINGKMRDMVVYYSNTGGIYSRDVETDDLIHFYKQNEYVNDEIVDCFKQECSVVLTKINYLYMLINYQLFNQLG